MTRNTGLTLLAVLISLPAAPYVPEALAQTFSALPDSVQGAVGYHYFGTLSYYAGLGFKQVIYVTAAVIWLLFAILLGRIFVAFWGNHKKGRV